MGSSTVVATVLPEWQNTNHIAWMLHCYRYCIFLIQSRTRGEKDSNGNAANNQHCLCSFLKGKSHNPNSLNTLQKPAQRAQTHMDCLPNNWNYILIEFDFSACSFHLSISPIALKSPESSLKQMQHHKLNPRLFVCGLCIYSRFQVFGARLLSNQRWI